jgi:hypothetical protein
VSRALDAGFASIHALPMRLRTEAVGALNLFGARPGPLPIPSTVDRRSQARPGS